jgi:probable F420-dependent oxidoreductase
MAHPRTFRFAAELHAPLPGSNWVDSFKELEDLGYSTLFLPDHFDEGPGPLATLGAAAVSTSTLHLGVLVLDCDYRHPAVVQRELATIDQLSGGRLEIGLGAGWKKTDYDRSGIPMERPGIRVDRMIEHTAVIKGLFGSEPLTFSGEHYQITEMPGLAGNTPGECPPILIGGGAPRVLGFAGRHADIIGVNASIHSGAIDTESAHDALPERIDAKVARVRETAGKRFDDIELNAWLSVAQLTTDTDAVASVIAELFSADVESVLASPLALIGNQAEVGDRLRERRERWGYSYTTIPGDEVRAFAPVVAELTGT